MGILNALFGTREPLSPEDKRGVEAAKRDLAANKASGATHGFADYFNNGQPRTAMVSNEGAEA